MADESVFDVAKGAGTSRKWIHYAYFHQYQENGEKGIEGLKHLLKNLENTQTKTVLSHLMIEETGRRYQIYTDSEVNELIGILKFPLAEGAEPYSVRVKKLKNLVGNSFGSEENPWISKLDAEKAIFRVSDGDGIVLDSLQMTYERRGRLNEERGNGIEGFDRLLENFKTTQAKEAVVHGAVDGSQREYSILTDPEINELIGLLRFPVKNSAS